MTPKDSEIKITTVSETGSNGVGHSKLHGSKGEAQASPEELTRALYESQKTIEALQKQLAEKPAQDNSIDKLTAALTDFVKSNQQSTNQDNIMASNTFTKMYKDIDGASMMEAQAMLVNFQNESKVPISVPKSFATSFGPSLAVSVNGVRVAVPCDGKTYFINETHAEAIRERIAKVDRITANTEPDVVYYNT